MNYLKVHLTFFSISLFFIANAQITTFDHIDREISSPSLPYETITESADSIFDDWHLQNPNDTGLAPYEKQFFRWRALAESRSHIAGDSSVLIADIGKVMYNKIGSFPYCNTGPTKNPWTLIGPNPEPGDKMIYGIVNCIAVDPTDTNIIYSGTQEGGLFKSVDGGQNWTNITDKLNLSGLGVMSIAIDPEHPDTIIVGTYSASFGYTGWLDFSTQGYGIIRSEDGGTSWSTTSLTASQEDGHITVIRFNPANSMTVFAAGSRGIYKSLDNGKTWNQVFSTTTSSTLNNIRFIDLEIALGDTNNICASSIKIGGANTTDSTARVFCSSNGGNTFVNRTPEKVCEYTISGSTTNFNRGAFAIALDVSPADSSNIYAFFASGSPYYGIPESATLCKTSNAGQNWSEIFDQSGSTASTVLNVQGGRWGRYRYQFELSDSSTDQIYVGGDVMLFYDVNSSTFWSKRSVYSPTKKGHADIRWIHNVGTENGKDILYIANDGGVAKTKNSGADWVSLNGNGFATSQIHGFASWPSNSFYAYGAMHNLQGCIGDGAKKLAQKAPGSDGGYTIPEPGSDNYFYTNSNAGLYRSVRNNNNSLSTSKRIDNYYGYFDAKFDAVKTDKVKFYFSGEGVIKVYSPQYLIQVRRMYFL